MDELWPIILVILWLILIVGGPAAYMAWQTYNEEYGTARHFRLTRCLRGWLVGFGISVLMFLLLPRFLIILPSLVLGETLSDSDIDSSTPGVQILLAIILPPICCALGFLWGVFISSKQLDEEMFEDEDEEPYKA